MEYQFKFIDNNTSLTDVEKLQVKTNIMLMNPDIITRHTDIVKSNPDIANDVKNTLYKTIIEDWWLFLESLMKWDPANPAAKWEWNFSSYYWSTWGKWGSWPKVNLPNLAKDIKSLQKTMNSSWDHLFIDFKPYANRKGNSWKQWLFYSKKERSKMQEDLKFESQFYENKWWTAASKWVKWISWVKSSWWKRGTWIKKTKQARTTSANKKYKRSLEG